MGMLGSRLLSKRIVSSTELHSHKRALKDRKTLCCSIMLPNLEQEIDTILHNMVLYRRM